MRFSLLFLGILFCIIPVESRSGSVSKDFCFLKLEASGCLGNCKIFSLSIDHNSRMLMYKEKRASAYPAEIASRITRKDWRKLLKLLEEANVSSLNEQYGTPEPDGQNRRFTFVFKNYTKYISYQHMIPAGLRNLEKELESMAERYSKTHL